MRIDLTTLSLPDMLDQQAEALQQAASLSQKADWVVMAAALLVTFAAARSHQAACGLALRGLCQYIPNTGLRGC